MKKNQGNVDMLVLNYSELTCCARSWLITTG